MVIFTRPKQISKAYYVCKPVNPGIRTLNQKSNKERAATIWNCFILTAQSRPLQGIQRTRFLSFGAEYLIICTWIYFLPKLMFLSM